MTIRRKKRTLQGILDALMDIFVMVGDKEGGKELMELLSLIDNPDDKLAAIEEFLCDVMADSPTEPGTESYL